MIYLYKNFTKKSQSIGVLSMDSTCSQSGMIEFHSRPALFLIPVEMIYQFDLDMINLLTQGIYGDDHHEYQEHVLAQG
jgi:hypothetical protein